MQHRRTRGDTTPPVLITSPHDASPMGFTRQPLQLRPAGGGGLAVEFRAGGGLDVRLVAGGLMDEFMGGFGVVSCPCVRLKRRVLKIRKIVVGKEAIALMFF